MSTPPAMLHPELWDHDDTHSIYRNGRRLDHAETSSKPLRAKPEPQPRGAKIHGNRPVDQAEAAARFIAAPEHEKMHDERLWDLRQKRDREMHGIPEKNFARLLPPSRNIRSPTSTTTSINSRPMRARTASMYIGRATPPNTTAPSTASSTTTAPNP